MTVCKNVPVLMIRPIVGLWSRGARPHAPVNAQQLCFYHAHMSCGLVFGSRFHVVNSWCDTNFPPVYVANTNSWGYLLQFLSNFQTKQRSQGQAGLQRREEC